MNTSGANPMATLQSSYNRVGGLLPVVSTGVSLINMLSNGIGLYNLPKAEEGQAKFVRTAKNVMTLNLITSGMMTAAGTFNMYDNYMNTAGDRNQRTASTTPIRNDNSSGGTAFTAL